MRFRCTSECRIIPCSTCLFDVVWMKSLIGSVWCPILFLKSFLPTPCLSSHERHCSVAWQRLVSHLVSQVLSAHAMSVFPWAPLFSCLAAFGVPSCLSSPFYPRHVCLPMSATVQLLGSVWCPILFLKSSLPTPCLSSYERHCSVAWHALRKDGGVTAAFVGNLHVCLLSWCCFPACDCRPYWCSDKLTFAKDISIVANILSLETV